jgi:outer membrane protein TolC
MSPRKAGSRRFRRNHFAPGAMHGRLGTASVAQAGNAAMRISGQRATTMRQALLLGVAFCVLPLAGASADTLQDALDKAYLANPTLQAERAQLRATDEGLPQAIALRRPTVTGSADAGLEQLDASKVSASPSRYGPAAAPTRPSARRTTWSTPSGPI